jgi:hypothetical protein
MLAEIRNVPLISLEEALSADPQLPLLRRRNRTPISFDAPILIVDDTICSGLQMLAVRSRARQNTIFAAVYGKPAGRQLVDYCYAQHPDYPAAFEWGLLHDDCITPHTLVDFDGVLCEDWHGCEESDPAAYDRHLNQAAPLRVPTYPVLAVVTGRLEIHRAATERWLAHHGVQYGTLHMFPATIVPVRSQLRTEPFKANVYQQYPEAQLFLESCPKQAQAIHTATGRPVLDFTNMRLLA